MGLRPGLEEGDCEGAGDAQPVPGSQPTHHTRVAMQRTAVPFSVAHSYGAAQSAQAAGALLVQSFPEGDALLRAWAVPTSPDPAASSGCRAVIRPVGFWSAEPRPSASRSWCSPLPHCLEPGYDLL